MKVEIDTVKKTIKVLDECRMVDLFNVFYEIDNYREYTLLPNTIINTITIKDVYDPFKNRPYINPWTIERPPYTRPVTWCGNENTTISGEISTNTLKNNLL